MTERGIKDIARDLRTQDNRITFNPIFILEEERIIWGLERGFEDKRVWVDGERNILPDPPIGKARSGCRLIGIKHYWAFITAALTENGLNEYLKINAHNLKKYRVRSYVQSGYRNKEWETIRAHVAELVCDSHPEEPRPCRFCDNDE